LKNGIHAKAALMTTGGSMAAMIRTVPKTLALVLALYAAASLAHFIHNAEFLGAYPNLPAPWSRGGVYFAWMAVTAVGLTGWIFMSRGYRLTGLLMFAIYAVLGLDSLGHYVLAPMSAHTTGMNVSILLEVGTAALLLMEVARFAVAAFRIRSR
jgi:hypothetical protein